MRIEVNPNISNFIKSLRDVGYTFEIAVADVLDNSISAKATEIKIYTVPTPELIFCMLDNGIGMSEAELIEAMRLATQNPEEVRDKKDLGRFGLGLKTASFSQCKQLTVLSKKDNKISLKQWDLDYLSKENKWWLLTPNIEEFETTPLMEEFNNNEHGTLVIWKNMDRYEKNSFSDKIDKLKKHLSLVFHRFLEGTANFNKLKIFINNSQIKPFNPFNPSHDATKCIASEKINIYNSQINITPYILPYYKNLSQQEWDEYATEDGYIKSQGFYLYRANRLLIHGTWWGLHKATDAHKLVRIKIDISNNQDKYWGIDIKKSTANPMPGIKNDLKRIILEVTKESLKPISRKSRQINDKRIIRFWKIIPFNDEFHFGINKEHPIYSKLVDTLSDAQLYMLNIFLKGIEAYLPLESIQAQLQQNPHQVKQEQVLSDEDIKELAEKLKSSGISKEYIESLLKTEIFKNKKGLLAHE